MAKGLSLHIGLNKVDPKRYAGWDGPLTACEADANDMASIARDKKFEGMTLLTKDATRAAVKSALKHAATQLKSGDIFFLTYSGHGGQLPDMNGDEPDRLDETWCLFDGQLVDDEIFKALGTFASGVRIIALSDSCHSGTVLKNVRAFKDSAEGKVYRNMPHEVALRTYRDNRAEYDPILNDKELSKALDQIQASGLLISGCQDNQLSMDGAFNGLFTSVLLNTWNNGAFERDYRYFFKRIVQHMPPDQTPNFFRVGPVSTAFERSRPFTI
jgi:hypothetical protein